MLIGTDWTTVKDFATSRGLSIQYIATSDTYYVFAIDGPAEVACQISIISPASTDQTDFETNFKSSANKPLIPITDPLSRTDQFTLKAIGYSGIATKGTTSNIDYKVGTAGVSSSDRYIRGMELILTNHVFGDSVNLQIVDNDNLLGYGVGTVLDQFATNWYIKDDEKSQGLIMQPLRAHIPGGLYIRIVYSSTGTVNDVNICFNLVLDQKTS